MKENSKTNIRKVNETDVNFLFNLRNRPDVYKYFKNPREVKYEEHINWISPILNNQKKDVYLYIILYGHERVGQIRFDLLNELNKPAEVSISVLSEYRGKGIATSALKQILDIIKEGGIKKIIAEVKEQNQYSIRFFKEAGFEEKTQEGGYKIFEYDFKMKRKIKIGLGIRTFESHLIDEAYKYFEQGLIDFVEIIIRTKNSDLDDAFLDFNKYSQIPYVFHGPYAGDDVNLANPDKEKWNLQAISKAINFIKKLKGQRIILHLGYEENERCSPMQTIKIIKQLSKDFKILSENNPFFGENWEKMYFSKPGELNQLIPNYCGLCLDFTHAYTVAKNLNINPNELFEKFLSYNAKHFHVNGGRKQDKQEFPIHLKESDFDLKTILSIVNQSEAKTITIETNRKSKESLQENLEDINFLRGIK